MRGVIAKDACIHPHMLELEKGQGLSITDREQVNDALEAVLATEKFEAAPQMSAFLHYVVKQAAEGNQSRIKAFTVAVDALGKPSSFDPQNDPVVRVLAGRLRAALAAYNEEHTNAPVIITMKPGSYVPLFKRQISNAPSNTQEIPSATDIPAPPPGHEQAHSDGVSDPNVLDSDTHANETQIASENKAAQEVSEIAVSDELDDELGHSSSATDDNTEQAPVANSYSDRLSAFFSGEFLKGKFGNFFTAQPILIACVAAVALLVSVISAQPTLPVSRTKPSMPAVFVSAINQGNSLENSLNAVVSSVMSESDQVQVYRILETGRNIKYWPEDYILTLAALNLPEEKRVTLQLVEAETGRIVYSQAVDLEEQADDQLTQAEFTQLMDAAKSIVSKTGPLIQHYKANQQ